MQNAKKDRDFTIFENRVGNFNVRGKTLLIPEMNPLSSHLLAAVFRSHEVPAEVLPTYDGLRLGKEFTSGKECFPCQVTLGDLLYYLNREKERLGTRFDPTQYVYFMPDTDGPCRFGMYNKFQRIVLDTFPDYKEVRIASLSSRDAYSVGDLIDAERSRDFRKAAYCGMVLGDLLERLLWRVRPYEAHKGSTNAYVAQALERLCNLLREHAVDMELEPVLSAMDEILRDAPRLMDPAIPPKPLIGVVGEIYLRSHVRSNQHLIENLEKYGAEVVNASVTEWVNYTTYDKLRKEKQAIRYHLGRLQFKAAARRLKTWAALSGDAWYQGFRHRGMYKRAIGVFDIRPDHPIRDLEKKLTDTGHYNFDVGGEACLSISGAMHYMKHGFDGVVNVFPFTCMPSTATSAVLKPLFSRSGFPYLDAAFDGTFQPGRETAVRTFVYQAALYRARRNREGAGSGDAPGHTH